MVRFEAVQIAVAAALFLRRTLNKPDWLLDVYVEEVRGLQITLIVDEVSPRLVRCLPTHVNNVKVAVRGI